MAGVGFTGAPVQGPSFSPSAGDYEKALLNEVSWESWLNQCSITNWLRFLSGDASFEHKVGMFLDKYPSTSEFFRFLFHHQVLIPFVILAVCLILVSTSFLRTFLKTFEKFLYSSPYRLAVYIRGFAFDKPVVKVYVEWDHSRAVDPNFPTQIRFGKAKKSWLDCSKNRVKSFFRCAQSRRKVLTKESGTKENVAKDSSKAATVDQIDSTQKVGVKDEYPSDSVTKHDIISKTEAEDVLSSSSSSSTTVGSASTSATLSPEEYPLDPLPRLSQYLSPENPASEKTSGTNPALKLRQQSSLLYVEKGPRYAGSRQGLNSIVVLQRVVRGSSLWDLVCDIIFKTCRIGINTDQTKFDLEQFFARFRSMSPKMDLLFDQSNKIFGDAQIEYDPHRLYRSKDDEEIDREVLIPATKDYDGSDLIADEDENGVLNATGDNITRTAILDTELEFYKLLQSKYKQTLSYSDVETLFRICRLHAMDISHGSGRKCNRVVGIFEVLASIPHKDHDPSCFYTVVGDELRLYAYQSAEEGGPGNILRSPYGLSNDGANYAAFGNGTIGDEPYGFVVSNSNGSSGIQWQKVTVNRLPLQEAILTPRSRGHAKKCRGNIEEWTIPAKRDRRMEVNRLIQEVENLRDSAVDSARDDSAIDSVIDSARDDSVQESIGDISTAADTPLDDMTHNNIRRGEDFRYAANELTNDEVERFLSVYNRVSWNNFLDLETEWRKHVLPLVRKRFGNRSEHIAGIYEYLSDVLSGDYPAKSQKYAKLAYAERVLYLGFDHISTKRALGRQTKGKKPKITSRRISKTASTTASTTIISNGVSNPTESNNMRAFPAVFEDQQGDENEQGGGSTNQHGGPQRQPSAEMAPLSEIDWQLLLREERFLERQESKRESKRKQRKEGKENSQNERNTQEHTTKENETPQRGNSKEALKDSTHTGANLQPGVSSLLRDVQSLVNSSKAFEAVGEVDKRKSPYLLECSELHGSVEEMNSMKKNLLNQMESLGKLVEGLNNERRKIEKLNGLRASEAQKIATEDLTAKLPQTDKPTVSQMELEQDSGDDELETTMRRVTAKKFVAGDLD